MNMLRMIMAALLLLCAAGRDAAADGPVTSEVQVQASADNATDARALALKEAEQKAFRQLLEQYAPERADMIAAHMPPEQVSAMVTGFELVEEKMTADTYRATVIISFDPAPMRRLIGPAPQPQAQAGAESAEPAPPAAVMALPVLRKDGQLYLWEGDNFWRNVWNSVALEKGGGRVVMPYGDPSDLLLLRSGEAPGAPPEKLLQLAARYGTQDVLLALASYRTDSPVTALDIALTRIGKQRRDTSRATYMAEEGETYEGLLVRAANDIVRQTADDLRAASAAGGDASAPPSSIEAIARAPQARDWNLLRGKLEALPAVQAVEPRGVSYGQVEMRIIYRGTPQALGESLLAADLAVSRAGDRLLLELR